MNLFEIAVTFYIINYYLENYNTIHNNFREPFVMLHDKLFPLKMGMYIKKENDTDGKKTNNRWPHLSLCNKIILKKRDSYYDYTFDYIGENNEVSEASYSRITIEKYYIYSSSNLIEEVLK